MAKKNDMHAVDPDAVLQFLRKTLPFKELEEAALRELSTRCKQDFFAKGTLVFQQDVTEVTDLYLINRGGVKVYLTDVNNQISLKDFRGEGGYFGALAIIRGSRANLNVETVEDTFCYLVEKEAFLDLIQNTPNIAQYYLQRFSEDVVGTAYSELRGQKARSRPQDAFYLFSVEIADVIKRALQTISRGETIQTAASLMSEYRIGSLLVRDQARGHCRDHNRQRTFDPR